VLLEAMTKQPTRLLAYSLMPNHWHLVLWPQEDYQGRFKSFPVQADDHYYAVVR
jgi:putative transposase